MKLTTLIVFLIYTFNVFSSEGIQRCGEGPNDRLDLEWQKALKIKIDVKVIKLDAFLCLGNTPGNPFEIKDVIYRDTAGLEKLFLFDDLATGTHVLLTSEDIDFGVVKKGNIMTFQLKQELLGDSPEEGTEYTVTLKFLRNLAKIPFDNRDHRKLILKIEQDSSGEFYPRYGKIEFDEVKIRISAPSLVINKIDLIQNNQVDHTILTNQLPELDEL